MNKSAARPPAVTFVAIFVLCITVWNTIRCYAAIANWQILSEFNANPAYILGTAIFWMLTGFWLFWNIRKGLRPAIRAGLAAAGLYYLWYWVDRFTIQSSQAPNVLFSAILSTILLVIFSLSLSSKASRAFLNKEK
jgi:hypothetical protein